MVLYLKMIVWEPEKNNVRKPRLRDLMDAVYTLLQLIPVGYVTSYSEIARVLGLNPRVVARILKMNRNPVVIPCHRVVASNGELKGYRYGGVRVKKKLLEIEGVRINGNKVDERFFYKLSWLINDE